MNTKTCLDCGITLELGSAALRCSTCRIERKRKQRYESAVRWARRIMKEQTPQ